MQPNPTLNVPRPNDPLDAAALCFGGVPALTEALGYSVQAYYMWRHRRRVPRRAAMAIELATKGQVTADQILALYAE